MPENKVQIVVEVDAKTGQATIRQLGQEMEAVGRRGAAGFGQASAGVDRLSQKMSPAVGLATQLAGAVGAVGGVMVAKDVAMSAARYETLGAAMEAVGAHANYTRAEMDGVAAALQRNGIAMIESRAVLTRMTQAHIDLSKATGLARIAQDAAVIGNINSSEAFERMIQGIQSAEVEILRNIGLSVNFENSYKLLAAQLGKTSNALSEEEKTQARVNVVMAAGAGIAGTYEAAMGTAGKQILSMERYTADLGVKFGEVFQPSLTLIVEQLTQSLKDANHELDNKDNITGWGETFRSTVIAVEAEVIRLAMLLDKVGGTMTSGGMLLTGVGSALGIESSKSRFEAFAAANMEYEARYQAGDRALQALADKEVALQKTVQKTGAATQAARAAGGQAAKSQAETEQELANFERQQAAEREKASADHLKRKLLEIEEERTAELAAAKSRFKSTEDLARAERAVNSRFDAEADAAKRDAAAKATKGQASAMRELTKTMDDYRDAVMASLPEEQQAVAKVRKEYATYRESIEDGLKKHPELAGEATKAMAGLAVEEEKAVARTRERAAAGSDLARVTDAYNDAVMESLPEQERAVAEIAKRYDEARDAVWRWAVAQDAAGKSTEEVANEVERLYRLFNTRQAEATSKALEHQRDQADKTTEIWKHTYDNLQDLTADWIYDLEISWSSLGDLAWRTASQMVSAWAWSQASMTWSGPSGTVISGATQQPGGGSTGTALQGASLLSNLASGYSTAANMTYTWNGVSRLFGPGSTMGDALFAPSNAEMAADPFAYDAYAAGGGSNLFSSIPGGPGAWFSAYNAFNSFSEGNEVAGAGHTAAAIAAFTGNPLLALGIELGTTLLGGLFGEDENRFTLTELDSMQTAPADRSWDRYEGFQSMGQAGLWTQGNDWYQPIQDAYVQGRDKLTEAFNQQAASLKESMSDEAWTAFATALESETLDYSHTGNFYLSDAQGVLESAMRGFAQELDTMLTTALQAALPVISEELLSSDSFAILSGPAQQFVRDQLASGTVESVQQVSRYFDGLTAITAQIDQAVADHDLTEYEKNLRQINQQFEQWSGALEAAGVDLERYTTLTTYHNRALRDLANGYVSSTASALRAGLQTEVDRLNGNVDSARSRYLELLSEEAGKLDDLSDTLNSTIKSIRSARSKLYEKSQGLLPGDQQLRSIDAEIARIMAVALDSSDPKKAADALSQVESLADEYISVSEATRTDWRDYGRDLAKMNNLLASAEDQANTLKTGADDQLDALRGIEDAVNGAASQAMTLDEARQQYEQAVYELSSSNYPAMLAAMTDLYTPVTNIEALIGEHLTAIRELGAAMVAAGLTNQWVNVPGTNSMTWTSAGGATAVASQTSPPTSIRDLNVVGVNGAEFNMGLAADAAVKMMSAAMNEGPDAVNAAAHRILAVGKDVGLTMSDIAGATHWDLSAIQTWADANGVQRFATGGSFIVDGPAGVDNLTLPSMRVQRGEMVHVSRPDSLDGLRNDIRALLAAVERLTAATTSGDLSKARHLEKIKSILDLWDLTGNGKVPVTVQESVVIQTEAAPA
ncbi:MAG: hypothetical protein ACOY3Z_00865 [Thermodesulfobacteriota bacterium]